MAGSIPRRARHLIPAGLPHGREAAAACAVLVVLAHLLLAQLTFVLAVAFAVNTRLSRWRLWWLIAPAAAGLVMTLAIGPGHAAGGFAAGPAHILGYLGHGHLIVRLTHPLGALGWSGNWLPEQFPIALIAGAAEAAVIGWLDWVRTDEWALAPRRPGAIAAIRGALAARMISSGTVLTRDGCALGVVADTGAIAELRWSQLAGGTLVVGASAREATVTSLQVVHAALRRRKPLVVVDAYADESLARVIETACLATGTPLRLAGIDLGRVIGERTAALVTPRSAERAVKACGDLAALAADLRRIGVDGDALVWVPGAERLPAQSLAALIREGGTAGLAVLVTTAWPAAATELAGLVGTLLIHRIADPALAAALAARTGTRLLPAAEAAALAGMPTGGLTGVPAGGLTGVPAGVVAQAQAGAPVGPPPGSASPGQAWSASPVTAPGMPPAGVPMVASGMGHTMSATGLVLCPVVQARTLLSLAQAEFVLAVSAAGHQPPVLGRLVPARLPPGDAGDAGDAWAGGAATASGPFGPRGRS